MTNRNFARLGGLCGLLFVLLMVPAYVVGSPDAPPPASALGDLVGYFGSPRGTFVLANGVLAVFSTFFFLWFLGALHGLIRGAEGEEVGLSSAALAGGTVFIALSCAGYAAEGLYPATLMRFEAFGPGALALPLAAGECPSGTFVGGVGLWAYAGWLGESILAQASGPLAARAPRFSVGLAFRITLIHEPRRRRVFSEVCIRASA